MVKLGNRATEIWPELIERIRAEHNGIVRVDLHFGRDGENTCRFSNDTQVLARGDSGQSMQEAVERCCRYWQTLQDNWMTLCA